VSDDVERDTSARPPLAVVKGDATPEEVAALVAVLQSVAARGVAPEPRRRPRSEWAAPHRGMRATFPSGPGGWRSSSMPR
jgi:hypothetical protein